MVSSIPSDTDFWAARNVSSEEPVQYFGSQKFLDALKEDMSDTVVPEEYSVVTGELLEANRN